MKKAALIISICFLTAQAAAQDPSVTSTAAQMGTIAGAAYACKAGESLKNYELIASRILANTARDDEQEIIFLEEYARSKRRAMHTQERTPPMPCSDFMKDFEKQKIFQCTVMSDGSVKLPDGQWLKARGKKAPASAKK